jgi:hypothetical protein
MTREQRIAELQAQYATAIIEADEDRRAALQQRQDAIRSRLAEPDPVYSDIARDCGVHVQVVSKIALAMGCAKRRGKGIVLRGSRDQVAARSSERAGVNYA